MIKEEDVTENDEYLDADLVSILEGTPGCKKLFYRFCKLWRDFLDHLTRKIAGFAENDSGCMQLL
jgi:hypothetical protein